MQIKYRYKINQKHFTSYLIFYIYVLRLSNMFPNYLEVLEVNDAAEMLPIVPETIEISETSKNDQRNLLHVPRGASDEGHFFQHGGVLLL